MFQVDTSSKEIWNAEKQTTFLLRKYLEPKLFFAEITLCGNYPLQKFTLCRNYPLQEYPLQELPFAGTTLCRNYPLQELSIFTTVPCQQSFSSLNRLDPVSFEHLVLAPLCEPKSHHNHCSMQKGPNQKTRKMH